MLMTIGHLWSQDVYSAREQTWPMRSILHWRSVAVSGSCLLTLGLWAALVVWPVRAQAPVVSSFGELITLKPNGDADITEVWQVQLAPGVLTTLSRPLPLTDTTAVANFSVMSGNPVEYEVRPDQGRVVLRWSSKPDPQKPDSLFIVSYTIHSAVQAVDPNYLFTLVALPADLPYTIPSAVVTVHLPYAFSDSVLQYHLLVGGSPIANACYALPGSRTVNGQGACLIDDGEVAFTAGAFGGQPWEVSVRYPQAAPPPTAILILPSPTPMLQLTSPQTPAPFVESLLALAISGVVVGLVWAWARPTPSLPLHDLIVASIVAVGATLAAGLTALIWFRPGSFYWSLVLAFGGALLIAELTILVWSATQGHAYDRDRQQMLAGQSLAHWSFTAEEHRQFVASEVDRLEQSIRQYLMATAVITVIFGLFGALVGLPAAMGGIGLAAGLLATASVAVPYARLRARVAGGQDLGPGEVYVSGKGALLFGRYVPLQGFNLWVESVSLPEDEPLRLKFRTVSRGSRGGRIVNDVYVPAPADRRAEAETLAASYPITTGA